MRRLVYEINIGQRFLAGPLSQTVKSVEVLNVLRFDRNDISLICRVKFKNSFSRVNRLFDDNKAEVQELEKDREGARTYFVRRKLPNPPKGVNLRLVYLSTPWRVEDGVGRATFLGSGKQITGMLRALQKAGFEYKIISLTDAKFSRDSILGVLTDKQREVISKAYQEGYYEIPRRMGSNELASKLGMRNATFVAHRRKAEKSLLKVILNGF